jgi:membrane fusion protein (multidrug efflux system)
MANEPTHSHEKSEAQDRESDATRADGASKTDGQSDKKPDGGGEPASDDSGEDAPPKKKTKGLLQRPVLLATGAVLFVLVVILALVWWLNARKFETSDDAFIDTHIVRLAPQIAGRVTQVLADDNALVQPGQALILIDSADAETRVAQNQAQKAQAQSQVDNALAQIRVNEAAYHQAQADVAAAAAQADNAARDLARYEALQRANPAAVAQQQFDQARTAAAQTAAQRDSAAKAAASRLAQIAASRTQVAAGRAQVNAAQAELNDASINLGYNRIVAPLAGHIAQKSVAVGNYVQPGTQLMAIVPLGLWVTSNFKETQLAHMRVGQHVDVHVDACPGDTITGHVDSIQRGAGQAFGLLPPENATGNYVKVVQRVPVKIVLDTVPDHCPLGPGMSVEPKVRVR